MIIDIAINAFRKIKSNYVSCSLATMGIIVSSFIILIIFAFFHISKTVLIEYLCSNFNGLDSITVKIEDERYGIDISELFEFQGNKNVKNVFVQTSEAVSGKISNKEDIQIFGIYNMPSSLKMICGEELNEYDFLDDECKKIIIHRKLAEDMFSVAKAAVGEKVSVHSLSGKTYEFLVSGVYDNKVKEYETKNNVYGSYETISEILTASGKIQKYSVQAKDIREISELKLFISHFMNKRYSIDDYKFVIIISDVVKSVDVLISLVTSVFFIFACIIFVVSGINIRNVLLSIMENYMHLIGIQKAIGADDKIIIMEYMAQGIIISCLGTLISIGTFFSFITIINQNSAKICAIIAENTNMDFLTDIPLRLSINGIEIFISLILSCVIVIACCYSSVKSSISMKIVDLLRK